MIEGSRDPWMLIRLSPEQVLYQWEVISKIIPSTEEELKDSQIANIKQQLGLGNLNCWVFKKAEILKALIITGLHIDFNGDRSLLIYHLFGVDYLDEESWRMLYDKLSKIAKANNCRQIVAFSKIDRIIRMARLLGGDVTNTFIQLPLIKGD